MLPSSNRRIHSIHAAHEPSDAIKENPIGSSAPKSDIQSRPIPISTPVSDDLAPSLDKDDYLTIKKLITQHSQSSGSHVPIPSTPSSTPIQATVSTPKPSPIINLEESDDEQGL